MIELNKIDYLKDEVIENYKALHKIPELGFYEYKTSAFILKKLAEYGIEGKQVCETGIIATIKGAKQGKTIAIRADIDALPIIEQADVDFKSEHEGVMHACGHDAHVAMLLGAARFFSENRDKLNGDVRLIFQPAEEGSTQERFREIAKLGGSENGGAASMIVAGALENVDICYGLHVFPNMPIGTLAVHRTRTMASSDIFEFTICGKGGHGSSPETAIDPVGALGEIISAYNAFPSREISALDPCVLSIGTINTNSSWNIIPDKIEITGGLRTFSDEIRDFTFERLEEIATAICTAHKCKCIFNRIQGYSPTINHENISKQMVDVANKAFGEGKGMLLERPSMGSEDVGYYFREVSGSFGCIGCMPEDKSDVSPHNPYYKINLNALKYGVQYHINMVCDYLDNN